MAAAMRRSERGHGHSCPLRFTWTEPGGQPPPDTSSGVIRPCRDDEREAIFAIVNAAAERYRGVIPDDRWHEPYMPADELDGEIAAGVRFWGFEDDGELVGIMGIQDVGDVDLIRHASSCPPARGEAWAAPCSTTSSTRPRARC